MKNVASDRGRSNIRQKKKAECHIKTCLCTVAAGIEKTCRYFCTAVKCCTAHIFFVLLPLTYAKAKAGSVVVLQVTGCYGQ